MNSLIKLSALCILTLMTTSVFSQNFSRLVRENGLVMQRIHTPGQTPGTCVMNFHSDGEAGHADFIYMRATEESDSLNPNNMVLTDSGLLMISGDDDCSNLTLPDFGDNNVKLYVNGDIAVNSGNGTVTILSDERMKTNIQPLENSLDIIRQSNFVEFQYNSLSGMKSDKKYYGILAQEMQKVLPSSITKSAKKFRASDKQSKEFLMFNPNDLMYSGLNAIKELDQENQDLKERVAELERLVAQLVETKEINTRSIPTSTEVEYSPYLNQNNPNPIRQATEIEYTLPGNVSSAYLVIQDMMGRKIIQFELDNTPTGKVTFDTKKYGISTGTYIYSLIVNNDTIASKKMIIQ